MIRNSGKKKGECWDDNLERRIPYFDKMVHCKVAAGRVSAIWFIPEFSFTVGSKPALLKVRVWPWFAIRSLELIIDGLSVYSE